MSTESFLSKIAGLTRARVETRKVSTSFDQLMSDVKQSRTPHDFIARIASQKTPRIIAEVKRKSPSKGEIAPELDPVSVAKAYDHVGAAAISVLTEPSYFGGLIDDLVNIRRALPEAALLMKDFVIDPYQIAEARVLGADAVLLIHAMLGPETTKEYYSRAIELGLTPLVEVHDRTELEDALKFGAKLIGVNNRDLRSLKIDLAVSRDLAKLNKPGTMLISESGIESAEDICELATLGFDGFLIGTRLMRDKVPGDSLSDLIKAARRLEVTP